MKLRGRMAKFKILALLYINFRINKKRYNTLNSAYTNVTNTCCLKTLLTFTL